jgi:hypothetical protein
LATRIAKLTERDAAAKMLVTVGVATRTAERALPRDFDGEHGNVSGEDPAPGGQDLPSCNAGIGTWASHVHGK